MNDYQNEYDDEMYDIIPPTYTPVPYRNPNKMSGGEKALIAGIGVAGAIGAAYYLLKPYTGTGGSCTTTGSACNTAIQPYQTQFNQCWNAYMGLLNTFTTENIKAGVTGLSAAQQADLAPYMNCASTASKNIANVAHQYGQNPIIILTYFAGAAFLSSCLIYFGAKGAIYYKKYFAGIGSPQAGSSAATDASIDDAVNTGVLNPDDATIAEANATNIADGAETDTADYYNSLADEDIITDAEAEDAIAADSDIIDTDLEDIVGLFE